MDDIIRMAREAGFRVGPSRDGPDDVWGVGANLERFAALVRADERDRAMRENAYVLAERNKLAQWMMAQGYATGHGDTMEGLLEELEREVGFKRAELWLKRINAAVLAEREACAKVCDRMAARSNDIRAAALESAAENIRARGQA